MAESIDFVITWVDQTDEKWRTEKNNYKPDNEEMNTDVRYRDFGTLNYWFRAIEKYAPWVNKIHFVTYGHVPEWLNTSHPKLNIVKHESFIPPEYLPTFSSHPIEFNLHRIDGLAEKFVYFNDDVFINNAVSPEDFFKNGLPRDFGIFNPLTPMQESSKIVLNDTIVINKHFKKNDVLKKNRAKFFNRHYGKENIRNLCVMPWNNILGFYTAHLTASFLKQTFKEVWEKEGELLHQTSLNKFRTNDDINQYLISYWQICQGRFAPQQIKFGHYYSLVDLNLILPDVTHGHHKVICINDDNEDILYEESMNALIKTFSKRYPTPSSFER